MQFGERMLVCQTEMKFVVGTGNRHAPEILILDFGYSKCELQPSLGDRPWRMDVNRLILGLVGHKSV